MLRHQRMMSGLDMKVKSFRYGSTLALTRDVDRANEELVKVSRILRMMIVKMYLIQIKRTSDIFLQPDDTTGGTSL